jgi:hypothetical protein
LFLRKALPFFAFSLVAGAGAQTSWSQGSATISASWTAGSDVVVSTAYGTDNWQYEHGGPGSALNVNTDPTDGQSYITSSNYSQITGNKWDYSGAEQIMYWYAANYGSAAESVDWTFNFSAYSETNINAGWGVNTSFGLIYEDLVPVNLLYDVVGAGYGTGFQSMTDSVTYTSVIAPNTVDLLVGVTLSRSVLDNQTATPSPAAALPFAAGLLAARRRRRA